LAQDKVNEIDPTIVTTLRPSVSVPSYKSPQGELCGFSCFNFTPGLLGQVFQ